MPKSNRDKDVKIEKAVAAFLDAHFYSKEAEAFKTHFERITDKDLQIRGVDVVFGGNVKIDEKAKVLNGMLNIILQYPSVEISFIDRSGREQDGWFVRKDNLTDYYLFVAVFSPVIDPYELTADNIVKLNLLFVKKSEICGYLKEKNSNIMDAARLLRKIDYDNKIHFAHNEFHLKRTDFYAEKPINLVFHRNILKSFKSSREFLVQKGEIKKL